MPVPKPLRKPVDRGEQALKRLGVDLSLVRQAPPMTPLLKNAEGGLKAVLEAMRFSTGSEPIRLFLDKYDSIPIGDRPRLTWEAVAIAAGINIEHLCGAAMMAVASHSANVARIIAMSNQPKITQARVKFGLLPSGEKDRTALDMATGVLPNPKGPTFIGKAIFGSGQGTMGAQGADKEKDEDDDTIIDADDPDLDELFPDSYDTQQELIPIRQRLLEDGK